MYELVVLTMVEEGLILQIGEFESLGDSRPLKAPLRPLPSGEVSLLVFPHTHSALRMFGGQLVQATLRSAFSRSKASRAGWRYQCPVAHLSRQHL